MTDKQLASTNPESVANRRAYLERAIHCKNLNDLEGAKYFHNLAEIEWLNNRYFLGKPPF